MADQRAKKVLTEKIKAKFLKKGSFRLKYRVKIRVENGQVKGVMPPGGGITRENSPQRQAVSAFCRAVGAF